MTAASLNEIAELINQQSVKINQIKSALDIALGATFLDHSKAVIHAHLCMIDDRVEELFELNQKIGLIV